MTSAKITLMTLTVTGALIWRLASASPPPYKFVCPLNMSQIRISVLNVPPLTLPGSRGHGEKVIGILGKLFLKIIRKCIHRKCKSFSLNFTQFHITQNFLESISDNEADIAFPITRPQKMWLSSDSYNGPDLIFEEFIESPGYSLIMDVGCFNMKANNIVMKTLVQNTWPIIVFTLLLAGISGMCVWVLETHFNEEEFPRSFTKGSYEGFWWAFVSMTTVGYGDKTPKFVFGRIFGVLWILTGLVVIAIFTATATSALSISTSDMSALEGATIGVLNNTSAQLEAKQRGAKVAAFPSVDRLFSELKNSEIDGVFMDKYRAAYHLNKEPIDSGFKVFQSFSVKIKYYFAIKSPMDRYLRQLMECFRNKLMKNNDLDDLLMEYLKPVLAYNQDSDSTSLFSGKSAATRLFLLIHLGIFLGLVLIGVTAELLYRKLRTPTKKVQSREDEIDLKEVRVQSISVKLGNLKDVGDKVGQLAREVSKLQEQLAVISSQANGSTHSGEENLTCM